MRSRLTLFNEFHEITTSINETENVLIITSDFGIAAHLSYFKQFIHGYNTRKIRARRIYLI